MSPASIAKKPGHVKDDKKTQEIGGTKAHRRAGFQERISKMSNLRQKELPGGTVLEMHWSSPQAQKPQIG